MADHVRRVAVGVFQAQIEVEVISLLAELPRYGNGDAARGLDPVGPGVAIVA